MSIPKAVYEKAHRALDEWAILSGYRGSIAHGMYVPKNDPNSIDDKDVMAVCVPPKEFYFGYDGAFAGDCFPANGVREVMHEDWDVVIYEARKFIGLLAKGNPNVLSLLWLQPIYYIQQTEAGKLLVENRDAFVGKHVYHSFSGYAYGQLHKMESGNKRTGHMGDKRTQLVDKFGYDTKNAAHLIRLLRMGIEFLTDGELHVLREDASQLLEIKRGEWSLEQVKTEASRLFPLAEQAYINSKLRSKPDTKRVNELAIAVVETGLGLR